MSSTVVAKNLQVGADGTASNNFTIYQPASPDGTLRIGNGNTGTTSAQVVLTSAGNVGIGTSSPGQLLDVGGGTGSRVIRVNGAGSGTNAGGSFYIGNGGTTVGAFGNYSQLIGGAYNADPTIWAGPSRNLIFITGGGANERMRITSAGNVGIGTSSPGSKLDVLNGTLRLSTSGSRSAVYGINRGDTGSVNGMASIGLSGAGTNGYLGQITFSTGASDVFDAALTERMRIDSNGNLLVGATGVGGTAATRLYLNKGGTTWQVGPATAGSGNTFYVLNSADAGVRLVSGDTSWTANSDERIKTELKPFEHAAEKVCSIRAGTGRYLTDDENISRSFLIAQDVQKVLPEAVRVQDDEIGTLGLAYTEVIPLLTAAIQEQQAIINDLKARLDAANL